MYWIITYKWNHYGFQPLQPLQPKRSPRVELSYSPSWMRCMHFWEGLHQSLCWQHSTSADLGQHWWCVSRDLGLGRPPPSWQMSDVGQLQKRCIIHLFCTDSCIFHGQQLDYTRDGHPLIDRVWYIYIYVCIYIYTHVFIYTNFFIDSLVMMALPQSRYSYQAGRKWNTVLTEFWDFGAVVLCCSYEGGHHGYF